MCVRTLISFVYVLESRGSRVMVFVLVRVPLLRAQRDPHRLLGPIGKPNQKEGKKMLTTQDNAPARGECNWNEQRHPQRRNPLPVSYNNPVPNKQQKKQLLHKQTIPNYNLRFEKGRVSLCFSEWSTLGLERAEKKSKLRWESESESGSGSGSVMVSS